MKVAVHSDRRNSNHERAMNVCAVAGAISPCTSAGWVVEVVLLVAETGGALAELADERVTVGRWDKKRQRKLSSVPSKLVYWRVERRVM